MQSLSSRWISRVFAAGAVLAMLAGCSTHPQHHQAKVKSYDKSIAVGDSDPTYQENAERADVEVHYAQ